MEFVGGLQTNRKGHDYLFVLVDRFNKMCILMPYKNTINRKEVANFCFGKVQVYFGITTRIILGRDARFLSAFWTTLWENIDTKLKRYTTFHPQKDGKTEVVNKTLVYLLRGYNQKHSKNQDENMVYIQHYYNRVVHTYRGKSPFDIFWIFSTSTFGYCIWETRRSEGRSYKRYFER